MGLLSTLILAIAPMSVAVLAGQKDCENASDVGNWFVNFCEEKCACEQTAPGEFSHVCYREREEFTCMPASRRQRFLDTYKAVTTPGNPQYDQMRQLIKNHEDGFHTGIHSTQYFLPWHRWYIRAVEDILRNQDCRVTMPWWRWSKKSATWWVGTPFHPSATWLGTNGAAGQCVVDGPFASWAPPDQTCLRRSFQTASLPTGAQIASTLNIPPANYNQFSDNLEVVIHNLPHVRVGGHMVSLASPRAPEFFLHHGYIDQLWHAWQRRSSAHMNAYGSFPKAGHPLPHTYGPSDANVDDNFRLQEDQRIRYVTLQADPRGRGHFTMLPMCLWLKVEKDIFSFKQLDDGLKKLDSKSLSVVPQLPWKAPTAQEMEWWFTDANEKSIGQFKEKLAVAQRQVMLENEMLVNPVEKFENEASQMLGVDVRKLAEMLQLCPIGQLRDRDTRQCVKDDAQKKDAKKMKKLLRKSEVFLGDVVAAKDLE